MDTSENLNISRSTNFGEGLINFVNRRCELLGYEATRVTYFSTSPRSVSVVLESWLQFPPKRERRTVDFQLQRGVNIQADIVRKIAMHLDSMHLGVALDEVEQAMGEAVDAARGRKGQGN